MPARRLLTALLVPCSPRWRPSHHAQRIWVGRGGFGREAPKWAKRSNFDGSFNYCRGFFTSDRREDGGMGWWTDYPGADNNFSVRLGELTFVRVKLDATGQPDNVVVQLTDPLLYQLPAALHGGRRHRPFQR